MGKRFTVFVLLACLPVSSSFAVIPPVALILADALGATYHVGIGFALGSLIGEQIKEAVLESPDGTDIRIPINGQPLSAPNAPGTAPSVLTYSAGAAYFDSESSACSDLISQQISSSPTGCYGAPASYSYSLISSSPQCVYHRVVTFTSSGALCVENDVSTGYSTQMGCPSGYTLSAGICLLSNARLAAPDDKLDYSMGAGGFTPVAGGDVDAAAALLHQNSNGSVSTAGNDSAGKLIGYTITPHSDGISKTIQYQYQNGDGSIRVESITFDGSGVATSTGGQTYAGNLNYQGSTGTAAATENPPILNPDGSTNTGATVVQPVNIQFPNDYARENTTQSINDKTGQIKDKLTDSVDVLDPSVPAEMPFFVGTFDALKAWQLPAHSSQCPTGSFSWNSQSYVIDPHCQLINDHWGVLQTAMAVVWALLALFIVLGA